MQLKLLQKFKKFSSSSINRRMTVLFVPIFIVICLISSIVTYNAFSQQMESRIISDAETLVQKVSESVNYTFDDIKSLMVNLSRQNDVQRLVREYATLGYGEKRALENKLKESINYANTFKPYIVDIFVISQRGVEYSMMSRFNPKYDFYEQDWFDAEKFKSRKGISYITPHPRDYYFDDLYYDKTVVSAVFPIRIENSTIGYIMCDIDIKRITYLLEDLGYFDGEHIFITDEIGNLIIDENMNLSGNSVPKSLTANSSTDYAKSEIFNGNLYVFSKIRSNLWNVVAQIDYDNVTAPAKHLLVIYALVFGLSILLFIACTVLVSQHIKKPIRLLIDRMKMFGKEGKLETTTEYGDDEISTIGTQFEIMAGQINSLIDEAYIYEIQKKEMEYDALVKQLNPHFFYNVLQLMLTEAVCSDNTRMEDIVTALAFLMRYTLDNSNEFVTVKTEIEYAKNYLDLYKKRFETMFDYKIYVEDITNDYLIPKFLLQPILENCFKHAFKDKKVEARIYVSVFTDEKSIHLAVHDNGCGMSPQKLKALRETINSDVRIKSIGLKNTHQRISIKYSDKYGVNISSEQGESTRIECILPWNP